MPDLFFGGGLNETDPFNVSDEECIAGQNFVLDARRRNFRPRPPQDLKGTAPNAGVIRGIMQMIDRQDVSTTIVKSDNVIYEWDGGVTWTSKRTDLSSSSRYRATYWSLDDILAITDMDKADPLYKWDGTSILRLKTGLVAGSPVSVTQLSRVTSLVSAIHSGHGYTTGDLITIAGASDAGYNGEHEITVTSTNGYDYTVSATPVTPLTTSITADLGVELRAKYSIVKDNRMWLFNVNTDATSLPHAIVVSRFENVEDYDTAVRGKAQDAASAVSAADPFFLLTPDLKPINGVTEFFDNIIISTAGGRLYRLTGTSPADYNFVDYYAGSSAGGEETLVNAGNDVLYMKRDKFIERLSDTERSGDVAADDIGQFVQTTAQSLDDPIGVYDQRNQRVCWFSAGLILVYDKTVAALTPNLSPWSVWRTGMGNQFDTDAATYLRRPDGTNFSVYWGDANGRVYDLNGTGFAGDGGSIAIETTRQFRYISELPTTFDRPEGRVQYRRAGSFNLNMAWDWGEEYNETTNMLPLKGPTISGTPKFFGGADVFFNEDDYFNEGTITGDATSDNLVSTVGFSAVGSSPGFFLTVSADTTVKFVIDKLILWE